VKIVDSRLNRGRKDLEGPCTVCGSNANIEVHHVKSLRKRPKKGDFLMDMMSKMNRKQVPLCQKCHSDVDTGKYDGKSFKT
jgi:5-methylcytosine-specific restriction endonuclease McrA